MNEEPTNSGLAEQIDTLARTMSEGFDGVTAVVQRVEREVEEESRRASDFRKVTGKALEDLSNRAFPREVDREDLEARVAYVESQLGIDSGK